MPRPLAPWTTGHQNTMDIYACGDTPLLQPRPCPRWYADRPNPCSHVSAGQVDVSAAPGNRACPWLATTAKAVLRNQRTAVIRTTGAENLIVTRDQSGTWNITHCRDGYDRTIEQSSLGNLLQDIPSDTIQDIWIDNEMEIPSDDEGDDDDFGNELFGDDYPRGPVATLGLLSHAGAIYKATQDPYSLQELTYPDIRRPFAHTIFRQECNNRQRDIWATVSFPEQPNVLYRIRTKTELLSWLRGEEVPFRRIGFPSNVKALFASRGRAEECAALLESGEVYHWQRDDEAAGTATTSTLAQALSTTPSSDATVNGASDPFRSGFVDLPAVSKIALGLTMGAAVAENGSLYVFSLFPSSSRDAGRAHIANLDSGDDRHRTPGLLVPCLASINNAETKFVDVAAGDDHLVALTSEGKVYTVGSGFQGQLGIGDKQFELDNEEPRSYEWSSDVAEFAEDWQEMILRADMTQEGKKVVAVGAGFQSTILITSRA